MEPISLWDFVKEHIHIQEITTPLYPNQKVEDDNTIREIQNGFGRKSIIVGPCDLSLYFTEYRMRS